MADSFKLSSQQTQKVTLGCGTLIVIAIIVAIFSNNGMNDVGGRLDDLRGEVRELKKSIDAQAQQIRELHEMVKKRDAGLKTAEALPKNPFEAREPQKKSLP